MSFLSLSQSQLQYLTTATVGNLTDQLYFAACVQASITDRLGSAAYQNTSRSCLRTILDAYHLSDRFEYALDHTKRCTMRFVHLLYRSKGHGKESLSTSGSFRWVRVSLLPRLFRYDVGSVEGSGFIITPTILISSIPFIYSTPSRTSSNHFNRTESSEAINL